MKKKGRCGRRYGNWRKGRVAMWDEGIESNWSRLAEGMMLEIREWRELHPKATFTEIEEAVDRLMAQARASSYRMWHWPAKRGTSGVRVKLIAPGAPGVGAGWRAGEKQSGG